MPRPNPRGQGNTKRETQVLAALIAQATQQNEAAAQRQAQLPLTAGTKLAETDKMNIAVSGQLQRFVM